MRSNNRCSRVLTGIYHSASNSLKRRKKRANMFFRSILQLTFLSMEIAIANKQNQRSFRQQELILMKTLAEKLASCDCENKDQNRHNSHEKCSCCWSTGCLCPMPPRVVKIKDSFINFVKQKHDLMYRFIELPHKAEDYKQNIQELRYFLFSIIYKN